jgi:cytochrome d ubiquinol oxidase subunit II
MEHEIVTFLLGSILSFAIFMYVLLDGFDLGVGILFPFVTTNEHRKTMVAAIVPVWDGNETWLVLGAATLYGAFPVAYSTILPTVYMPIIIMLAALVFRGISFEFMAHSKKTLRLWQSFFCMGSAVATFCQGLILGTFVHGYSANTLATSTAYHWLTPFNITTGIAVMCGYALLGSTWMLRKTEGVLQEKMYSFAKATAILVFLFMVVITLWTPQVDINIVTRWFSIPNIYLLMPLPLLTLVCFAWLWRQLNSRVEKTPFYLSMLIFLFAYVGLAMSVWPFIIPHIVTVWQAAAPLNSQLFILCGLLVLVPVLCIYTAYAYHVFRGKTNAEEDHY